MGTAVSMVARRLLIRMRSTLFCRLSRYILRSTSAARSMAASTEPKRSIRSRAPLSPMPGAPGMLSMASPFSANRSATCAGITPRNSLTFAGPYHSSSLAGFSMETRSLTICSQALAHQDALDVVLQALAIHLALDLGGALDGRFHRTEALDQVPRALVADARRARNVVDGVALQREQVRHLRRHHAQKLLDLRRSVPLIVLGGIQHGDPLADDLHHVLIAGDVDHLRAGLLRAARDGADDVVGFEACVLQDRNPHGFGARWRR